MKRKRQQSGYIFKARGHWYVRYFEDRMVDGELRHDRIAKQIGEVTTRRKRPPRKIEDEARDIVAAASVTNAASEDWSATHENIWQRSANAFPAGQ